MLSIIQTVNAQRCPHCNELHRLYHKSTCPKANGRDNVIVRETIQQKNDTSCNCSIM